MNPPSRWMPFLRLCFNFQGANMGHKSPAPTYLADKLFAVRKQLKFSQSKMAIAVGIRKHDYARISEYERGRRKPSLLVLLGYAKAARISTDVLIDDTEVLPFD